MKKIARHSMLIRLLGAIGLLAFMCAVGFAPGPERVSAQTRQTPQEEAARYVCPMHPKIVSAKPGRCPTCGMALRTMADAAASSSVRAGNADPKGEDLRSISQTRFPEIRVRDQNGKELRFYSDLVKGRTVAISYVFTTCTTICPSLTATLRRVQQDLASRALDVQLISVSVDPTTDTPERLRDFAAKFQAGPGWTFVTGEKANIDSLLRALGGAVTNANDHTPTVLISNDVTGYRTRAYGLSSPGALVKIIADAASRR
jgi:protein SCO1/2